LLAQLAAALLGLSGRGLPRRTGDQIMRYDELLTVEEAAERLKISKHTLNRWRVTGEGPPFVKYGPRLVRYLEAALSEWEKRRTRRSTSDMGADAGR
jgi:excisionase family DNA binding protein